jgi:hypothetical protein
MAKSLKRKVAKKSPKRKVAKSPKRKGAKSPKRVVKGNKYSVCLKFRLQRYNENENVYGKFNMNALSAKTKAFLKKGIKAECASGFSSFEPIKNVSVSFENDHILVNGTLNTDPKSDAWVKAYKYDIANWLDTIQHSNLLNDGVAGDGYVYYVSSIKVC